MREHQVMTTPGGPFVLLSVLLVGATACEPPGEQLPEDARVAYDTIDGVEHVISGSRGAWVQGGAWDVDRSPVAAIGEMDGPEEYTFGQVAGVVLDDEGRIYVGDTQAKEVRVFSSTGEFLSRFGGEGEGPGEFRNISGLVRAPGGIAVLDGDQGRVTVFDRDGEVVRTFRLERPYMVYEYDAVMAFDQDGRFYDRARMAMRPGVDSMGIVRYSPADEVLDTFLVANIEEDVIMIERNGRPYMSFPRPLSARPSLAIGPDGRVYFTEGDSYRITVLSSTGDTIRVLRRRVQRRSVSDTERDSAIASVEERFSDAGVSPPRSIEIPSEKPVITDLEVDAEGNLWVMNQPIPGSQVMEWSVHDPEGRYLGAVAVPWMSVMDIGGDYVAGVRRGELDVAEVVVYPLLKGR